MLWFVKCQSYLCVPAEDHHSSVRPPLRQRLNRSVVILRSCQTMFETTEEDLLLTGALDLHHHLLKLTFTWKSEREESENQTSCAVFNLKAVFWCCYLFALGLWGRPACCRAPGVEQGAVGVCLDRWSTSPSGWSCEVSHPAPSDSDAPPPVCLKTNTWSLNGLC